MKLSCSYAIIVIFLCLSLIGLALLPLLPVKLTSSNKLPSLSVSFSMSNMSARVVEKEVTSKLEGVFVRLPGVKKVTSSSNSGYGIITLSLDRSVDYDAFRFEVSSLVRQIWPELPEGVSYPVISMARPDVKDDDLFMRYMLVGPGSKSALQLYAETKILPQLSSLKGLEKVTVEGALPMEWHLEYDYNRLKNLGISVSDIRSALTAYSSSKFVGTNLRLVSGEENKDTLNLSGIIVKKIGEKFITLDQLVSVLHKEQKPTGYYRINGRNVINMTLYATDKANRIKLADQIYRLQKQISPGFPKGYLWEITYDGTKYIRKELDKIYFRTGLTILILLLFVLLISRNLRYLWMITLNLAANICIAFLFYYLVGIEIELYSLAGITLSLGLIIDYIIIMTDHLLRRRNKEVFLAILAATLTTVASLSIIFFIDEQLRLILQDFARVLIINLFLSLVVTLFLVPALIDKLSLQSKEIQHDSWKVLRRKVQINRVYGNVILLIHRKRIVFAILLVLAFGIPLFLLPAKLPVVYHTGFDLQSGLASFYNKTLGSDFYSEKIKPTVNMLLGGTFRLFAQNSYTGSYLVDRAETVLSVYASMPNGVSLDQMNNMIVQLERYLNQFTQISRFQTSVSSANRASVQIFFQEKHQQDGFPNQLKELLIDYVSDQGAASWSVAGVGNGFNNEIKENEGRNSFKLLGYNYDELMSIAEQLRTRMFTFKRMKDVSINNQLSYYKEDYSEYVFRLNKEELTRQKILPIQLYTTLKESFSDVQNGGEIYVDGQSEQIKLVSKQSSQYDVWNLKNVSRKIGDTEVRFSTIASIQKEQMPQSISKEDQQYVLYVQYEYQGDPYQTESFVKKMFKEVRAKLPLGYSIDTERATYSFFFGKQSSQPYLLLFLVVAIIFVICSVLFNSIRQPFAIILVIPLSYIGIFLTFYLGEINFDQGGFASLILLSGITVNASIYIINDYNNIRRRHPVLSQLVCYQKAFNRKIIPIFLTVVSTALSFIPFIVDGSKEAFWYPLASGIIGGLFFSLVVIVFFLPLFMGIKNDTN